MQKLILYQMLHKLILKKLFLALLYHLHVIQGFAQDHNIDNKMIITLSPLSLIDFYDGASIRLGSEIKLYDNISFAIEGGTYVDYLNSTKINPKGYLLRPAFKYYLNKQNISNKYIAIEYQFKHQTFDMRDSIKIDFNTFEKQYGMKRKVHSVIVKFGRLKNIGESFILEWYFGVGIRHIRSHSNLNEEEQNGILTGEEGDCPLQEDIIRLTGTRIFPDFHAGIKLGFRIK